MRYQELAPDHAEQLEAAVSPLSAISLGELYESAMILAMRGTVRFGPEPEDALEFAECAAFEYQREGRDDDAKRMWRLQVVIRRTVRPLEAKASSDAWWSTIQEG